MLIEEAFEIDNIYYQKMINVFKQEHKGNLYVHHIIPKCFFKKKGLEIDNSKNNLIALTYKQHLLVHLYGYKCSKEIIKEDMLNAIQLLLNTANRFDEEESIFLAEEQIKNFNVSDERAFFFFEKAKKKYGNIFDYSKTKYINAKTKIFIHCNKCNGDFYQLPYNHLKYGCPICSGRYTPIFEQMVEKANLIHHNFYTYDKSTYTALRNKMRIICPLHGEFWQKPQMHIWRGEGCPKCRYIKSANKNRKTTKQFIQEAREIHGDKYDYSLIEYKNTDTKIKIYCNSCKQYFWQTPYKHLKGQGCPYCN